MYCFISISLKEPRQPEKHNSDFAEPPEGNRRWSFCKDGLLAKQMHASRDSLNFLDQEDDAEHRPASKVSFSLPSLPMPTSRSCTPARAPSTKTGASAAKPPKEVEGGGGWASSAAAAVCCGSGLHKSRRPPPPPALRATGTAAPRRSRSCPARAQATTCNAGRAQGPPLAPSAASPALCAGGGRAWAPRASRWEACKATRCTGAMHYKQFF